MPDKPAALLFDFDGTFADTAFGMAYALNQLREEIGQAALPLQDIRPYVTHGARGMLRIGFDLSPEDSSYPALQARFLDKYEQVMLMNACLFPGIEQVIGAAEKNDIQWGIVTNKAARFTLPLLRALQMEVRAAVVVCGDTCTYRKPHPEPLLFAARTLQVDPALCLYVGDDKRDVQAARAAGMTSVAAAYGYLESGENVSSWQADLIIEQAGELVTRLAQSPIYALESRS